MNEIYEKSLLLDFYGELLTQKQREICQLSMTEDWSLGEIAESLRISRQGVQDALKRSEKILFDAENKLGMAKRFVMTQHALDELSDMITKEKPSAEVIKRIEHLKEEIMPKEQDYIDE